MQPKFTLNTKGNVLTRIIAIALVFLVSTQVSFGQKTEEMRNPGSRPDAYYNPPTTVTAEPILPMKTIPSGVLVQRVNAPTVISAPGNMNNGNAQISFNFTNTNGFAVIIQSIATALADLGAGAPVPVSFSAYYKPGAIVGNPGPATAGNGWTLFGSANIAAPTYNIFPTAVPVLTTCLTGLTLNIPAGATYGIIIGTGTANLGYMNSTAAGATFTNGGCSIFVGGGSGWGGPAIPGTPANNPRAFIGSITFDQAICIPTNATQPIISSVPSNTCAGSPITLSVISGTLNGAANWVWYSGGSCGGASIGTGSSITVSPGVTTTYSVRGEGGCAPSPGPCGQQTVTVTPCTCLTPDVATICAGSIQQLTVTPTGATTQTFTSAGGVTIPASGNGSPYPNNIAVAGLPTCGVYVQSVAINGITHTWPGDIDIALKSPGNQTVILMSDIGDAGANGVSGRNIVLSDQAAGPIPVPISNGTWRPTNSVGTFGVEPDNFPAPATAPINPNSPTLASFSSSLNPNGNWSLLVLDDAAPDAGSITSWSITFRIVPTATWSGPAGTMFTNPQATTPYVAGSCTDAIWVTPGTTSTYTATFSGGACAPTQNVTVTVLPRPNIVITPNPGGCAPVTLTATGGIAYTWTPGTGLNATTGSSVIATPSSDQTYTVLSYGANGCSNTATVPVKGISTASVITAAPPQQIILSEGFDTAPLPAGWSENNLSNPIGAPGPFVGWWQGTTGGVGGPHSGADFRGCAFLSGSGVSTLSNWLISPVVTTQVGDTLTFWSFAAPPGFPDRLQVRWSGNGASTNVGATATSVGDFSNVWMDINPTYLLNGYSSAWTLYKVPITGIAPFVAGTGRMAFRYFVENGGPAGFNSNFIGVDDVLIARPLPGWCPNTVSTLSVNITGGVAPYTLVYTNGTTQTSYPGYTSGTPIQVSPSATTTYTVVSVIGANGCPGIGNTGSATVTVIQPPAITAQPANTTVCAGGSATFTVTATPAVSSTTYAWEFSSNGGATWNPATGAPYSGGATATLTVNPVTAGMNGYRFRVIIGGQCPPQPITSNGLATLQVNVPPTITTQPANVTVCDGKTATFSVVASTTVGTVTYLWQQSVDGGITWTTAPGAATSATYSFTANLLMNNYRYRVVVSVPPCATTVTSTPSTGVILTVNPLPVVTITSADLAITPGQTTTITGTSVPAGTPTGWSWTLNGNVVPPPPNPPSTGPSISVGINGLGTYQATATATGTGCTNKSNLLTIGAEPSDRLWIYPNPNNGNFEIRLFFDGNAAERRRIRIYNAQGQLVAQKEFDLVQGSPSYLQMKFELPRLAAGTYAAKVTGLNSGNTVSGLFVVSQ
ncbi:MAG: T9SS type A sorting domain-containing protein [Chitinophagaceae bacterium]|nr:T9SS type A sorting domain-containing protein [Chitinophagaceae bacterium]